MGGGTRDVALAIERARAYEAEQAARLEAESARRSAEAASRAKSEFLGLINGVLNYVKVDAGAVHYDVTDVVVDEVLTTCEALVAPQTQAKRLALRRASCDRRITVRADREKMQQVVLNC